MESRCAAIGRSAGLSVIQAHSPGDRVHAGMPSPPDTFVELMTLGAHVYPGLAIITAIHTYFWDRLARRPALPRALRWLAALLFGALAAMIPIALISPPWLGPTGTRIFFTVAFGWMGTSVLLLAALLATEPVRLGAAVRSFFKARSKDPSDPARRTALSRILGGTAALAGLGAAMVGFSQALSVVIQRVRVPLRKLPRSMDGTRLVQLSDVHVNGTIGRAYVEEIVARTNALSPDVVVITGDLIDGPVSGLRDQVAPLANLRARYGVFFVTGNHEYYAGAIPWVEHLATLGVKTLQNERVSVGEGEESFDLAGVHDFNSAAYAIGHTHDPDRALAGRDPAREVVLLAHQPCSVHDAARLDVGLQLSGHTHGGQIFPMKYVVALGQPFVEGLHRLGETQIYVSRGTGYWGPPMRVGAPPEIAEITLVCA